MHTYRIGTPRFWSDCLWHCKTFVLIIRSFNGCNQPKIHITVHTDGDHELTSGTGFRYFFAGYTRCLHIKLLSTTWLLAGGKNHHSSLYPLLTIVTSINWQTWSFTHLIFSKIDSTLVTFSSNPLILYILPAAVCWFSSKPSRGVDPTRRHTVSFNCC